MNRKFRIRSEEHSKAIQERLFELGHVWAGGERKKPIHLNKPFLFTEEEAKDITHADSEDYFEMHEYIESTLDDLFKEFKVIKHKLNNKYTAEIYQNKVVVGCQEFTKAKILELAELCK